MCFEIFMITRFIHSEENSLFNNECWENWVNICKRVNLDPYLSSFTKINLKFTKYLPIILETVKVIEEIRVITIRCLINFFRFGSLKCRLSNQNVDKWNYIKIRRFCTTKETNNVKRRHKNIYKLCI